MTNFTGSWRVHLRLLRLRLVLVPHNDTPCRGLSLRAAYGRFEREVFRCIAKEEEVSARERESIMRFLYGD